MPVALAAVGLGAILQSGAGIGFALVAAPFLVASLGSGPGVRTVILLSAILNAAILLRDRKKVRWDQAGLLFLPSAVMVFGVGWLVRSAPQDLLSGVVGGLTLLVALVLGLGLRIKTLRGTWGALAAGAVSGAMNVAAGIGGPPAALYALNDGWEAQTVRATLQAFFLATNLLAIAVLGRASIDPRLIAALAIGWIAGDRLARRIPQPWARATTLAIAAIGGLIALANGLSGVSYG